jgi:protein involved in polysaccharide export with SLBB domain
VVRVLESSLITAPAVVGWIAPVVLLPVTSLAGLAPAQLEALVAHELAHVRRHDYLVNLMQSAVETLLFFHPAVWWVSRRIRVEREHCCDDVAVAVCGDRVVYASALADLERMRGASFALAATDGSLVARVRRILSPSTEKPANASSWMGAVLVLLMVSVVPAVVSSVRAAKAAGQVQANPSTPAPQSKADEKPVPYQIRSTDVLHIVVSGEPTMSRNYLVQSDGVIIFPLMRPLTVVGLTTDAVAGAIAKALTPAASEAQLATAGSMSQRVTDLRLVALDAEAKLVVAQRRLSKLKSYHAEDPSTNLETAGVLSEPEVVANPRAMQLLTELRDLRAEYVNKSYVLGKNHPDIAKLDQQIVHTWADLRSEVLSAVAVANSNADLAQLAAIDKRAQLEVYLAATRAAAPGAAPKIVVTVTIVKPVAGRAPESQPEPRRNPTPPEPESNVSIEPHDVPGGGEVGSLDDPIQEKPAAEPASKHADYIVGENDVLTITSYDDEKLTGKFTVEADGTFTYPLIGRFMAQGLSLRDVEAGLKKRLKDGEFFNNPQITVAILEYKSQKITISGEVRTPGTYPIFGDTTLVEALSKAGGMLPTASGEAIITHYDPKSSSGQPAKVNLRDMQNGVRSENIVLRDGDTVFITQAATIYVFGYVNHPNAYPLQSPKTTVQQALSLAGGVNDRGSEKRIEITRIVNGVSKLIKDVKLTDIVQPGDTINVKQRIF